MALFTAALLCTHATRATKAAIHAAAVGFGILTLMSVYYTLGPFLEAHMMNPLPFVLVSGFFTLAFVMSQPGVASAPSSKSKAA